MDFDKREMNVTFGAGVIYSELIEFCVKNKVALRNVPSLPHINVVGGVVTGTHGSGLKMQAIANDIVGMRIINPNGELQILEKEDVDFPYYLHSFGALGAITEMTIEVIQEFAVKKCIYEGLSWEFMTTVEEYIKVMESGTYLSFFTPWES